MKYIENLDGGNVNYKEEIEIRKAIREKIYDGEKITKEEREWLVTHPVYHEIMGFPVLRVDVIDIKPNTKYIITIKKHSSTYPYKIGAVVSVPASKGKIILDKAVFDMYNREKKPGSPIKSYFTEFETNDEESFLYMSTIGKIKVDYGCQFIEKWNNELIYGFADGADRNFAMKKEVVDDNKIIYSCKSVVGDNFDALVFSLELNEVT